MRGSAPISPDTSTTYFSQLIGVMDRIEAADDAPLRDRLMASAAAVCVDQALDVSAETVAVAVDAQLAELPQALSLPLTAEQDLVDISGAAPPWKRPQTMADLMAQRQKATGTWFRERATNCLDSMMLAITLVSGLLVMLVGFCIGSNSNAQIGLISALGTVVVFFLPSAFACLNAASRSLKLEEATPTPLQMRAWMASPLARSAAQACLTSAVPIILKQDAQKLDRLSQKQSAHILKAEAEAQKRQEAQNVLEHEAMEKKQAEDLRAHVRATLLTDGGS
jgi:hypothetical protein